MAYRSPVIGSDYGTARARTPFVVGLGIRIWFSLIGPPGKGRDRERELQALVIVAVVSPAGGQAVTPSCYD